MVCNISLLFYFGSLCFPAKMNPLQCLLRNRRGCSQVSCCLRPVCSQTIALGRGVGVTLIKSDPGLVKGKVQ